MFSALPCDLELMQQWLLVTEQWASLMRKRSFLSLLCNTSVMLVWFHCDGDKSEFLATIKFLPYVRVIVSGSCWT